MRRHPESWGEQVWIKPKLREIPIVMQETHSDDDHASKTRLMM